MKKLSFFTHFLVFSVLFKLEVGEARALYNIGNVFHAKGKQQLWGCTQEPGELPPDVRDTLQRATGFYEWEPFSVLLY